MGFRIGSIIKWTVDAVPAAAVTLASVVPPVAEDLPASTAQTVIPPRSARPDWVAVASANGVIVYISEPNNLDELNRYREKTTRDTDGDISVTIVRREIAARLRVGMMSQNILLAMEEQVNEGYRPYIGDKAPVL
jgi:hypothetical protein